MESRLYSLGVDSVFWRLSKQKVMLQSFVVLQLRFEARMVSKDNFTFLRGQLFDSNSFSGIEGRKVFTMESGPKSVT